MPCRWFQGRQFGFRGFSRDAGLLNFVSERVAGVGTRRVKDRGDAWRGGARTKPACVWELGRRLAAVLDVSDLRNGATV